MAFSRAFDNSCRILLSASRRAQSTESFCTSLIHYQSNFNMKYKLYHFPHLRVSGHTRTQSILLSCVLESNSKYQDDLQVSLHIASGNLLSS
jgi:hypothetical protein